MANEKRKPEIKTKVLKQVRLGRFKVTVMEMKKTYFPDKDQKDFVPERTIEYVRCNVQHGRKWNNK